MSEILVDEWFKKGYKRPVFDEKYGTNSDDVAAAFEKSEESQKWVSVTDLVKFLILILLECYITVFSPY